MAREASGSLALLLLMLAAACAGSTSDVAEQVERAPVEARAMVDRAVATTGDLITYRIEVDADDSLEVDIPEVGAEIAGFRIVDVGEDEPVRRGERVVRSRWYQLRADLVGSYVLPPVQVRYRPQQETDSASDDWQKVTTSEIFVEVASVLPTDAEASDIKGLKPLRRVRPGIPWVWIVAITIASVLVVALLVAYWRRRRRGEEVPQRPAHELAFAALNDLRRTDFDDPLAVRRFYFQISEVIRAYVERRYGMNATDLTTEEILARLGEVVELDKGPRTELDRFLLDTDLVKFAHRDPGAADIEATYDRALGFVESTRPVSETEEQEAA